MKTRSSNPEVDDDSNKLLTPKRAKKIRDKHRKSKRENDEEEEEENVMPNRSTSQKSEHELTESRVNRG